MKNLAVITVPGNGFHLNSRVLPVCIHEPTMSLPTSVEIAGYGWTYFGMF